MSVGCTIATSEEPLNPYKQMRISFREGQCCGVVIYCDGHEFHVLKPHLDFFDALAKKGVGFVTIHWATAVERGGMAEKFPEWQVGR